MRCSARECTSTTCSYNDHTEGHTFADTGRRGGLDVVPAQVGACHRQDCTHTTDLECSAEAIRVGPGKDVADCLTYQPR